MDSTDKNRLYAITLGIDVTLLYIHYNIKLSYTDHLFFYIIYSLHMIFYYALYTDNRSLLNKLHHCVFLSMFYGLYTTNVYILGLIFLVYFCINVQWIMLDNRCILNERSTKNLYNYVSNPGLKSKIDLNIKLGYTSTSTFRMKYN